MVQKTESRRGRPRAYDPETALAQAMATFWDAGYAATSLDDLAAATGMNRPSLYGAFGDKRALYRQAIAAYRATARDKLAAALDLPTLRAALGRVLEIALASYLDGDTAPRGCFMIGTAVTEAVLDAEVRADLLTGLREFDAAFEARIRRARDAGELPPDADPVALGRQVSATLYYLSVRARAGEPRAMLDATLRGSLDLICGAKPTKRGPQKSLPRAKRGGG